MFALEGAGKKGFFILATILLISLFSQAQANPRYAAIVVDANTGEVLYAAHADAPRYPASLTKMMTLYLLFEAMEQGKLTLASKMRVSAHAASMPQTNLSLRAGDGILVRDAIPALVVRSANDVAAVVAEALGGSERNFARMMTDKAHKMNMKDTQFRNASGLPDSQQKTSARDMATLAQRLMQDFPKYYHYFSTASFHYRGKTYTSHNRIVRSYQGVDGLKTGYIRASGFNVATSAKRGDKRLIAVVMGGQTAHSRDQHMAQLLDRGFVRASGKPRVVQRVIEAAPAQPSVRPQPSASVKYEIKPAPLISKSADTLVLQREERPVPTGQTEVLLGSDWAVQVGSYHGHERARAQAVAATKWVQGEVAVSEVEISNRKLFRARLVGLQEQQARNACLSLSRQGMDCLVVGPHG
ncbi:D-alanyl-D-alanine carboxypeptidase family protein [Zobellella aerophila]|uniref:D-alanyl-D-alanine carboxypeptidase family protein n=1 Tax=Zobellella aerophila TaxID=870480 RepID=A0ABP6VXP0_9GAMM